jgi:hypothetical protein
MAATISRIDASSDGRRNATPWSTLSQLESKVRVKILAACSWIYGSIQGLTAQELEQLLLANFDKVSASSEANAYQDVQPRVSLASNS